MKRRILIPLGVVAVVAAIVAIAAGGGYSKSGNRYSATAAAPSTAVGAHKDALGTHLVDGKGRTLYLFEADKPNMSNCDSACLSIWPAFSAGGKPPVANGGVSASKLGVTSRGQGGQLVTYNGHPLYYYAGDQKPGDTTGQGLDQFGAKWEVVTPTGDGID